MNAFGTRASPNKYDYEVLITTICFKDASPDEHAARTGIFAAQFSYLHLI